MPESSKIIIRALIKEDIRLSKRITTTGNIRFNSGRGGLLFNTPSADTLVLSAANTVTTGDLVTASITGTATATETQMLNIAGSATVTGDLTVTGKIINE